MATSEKNILTRLYIVAGFLFLFAIAVAVKLISIQVVDGDKYRKLAMDRTERVFVIEPNRGNLISDDGSLLATSVNKYTIRFDAVTVRNSDFNENIKPLSDALGKMFQKPSSYYQQLLRKARSNKNRYKLIARNLDYSDYIKIKKFPLFEKGPNRGGLIVEQKTVREHPLGKIAERSVGYERVDEEGHYTRVGLEGAFGQYLRGEEGRRLKQKIAKGQWKPIGPDNDVEPKDGYDVVSTIDINIQDIAHHALLGQLEKYNADHGCVIVMEVATGEVKAISNLGRTKNNTYYERLNYAVGESSEPGSTFKLVSMVAALEDKIIDTSTVVDTENGRWKIYDRTVRDSKWGGYGKISFGKAFEYSSNTAFAKVIHNGYKNNPEKFVDRLMEMNLNRDLGLPIKGEGKPVIRYPGDKGWSGISLAWMSHGYEVSLTPLQTLTFYNAIANGGEMVRPRLIKEVKEWNKTIYKFDKEVINPSICSKETVKKVQALLKNVVESKKGTGHKLYSPNFSMAGKTGTAQKNYVAKDPNKLQYISSFAGYFPADEPKYSCIVVVHDPDKKAGFYGADVAGPVFKSVAHKIYATSPKTDIVKGLAVSSKKLNGDYEAYYKSVQKKYRTVPNVKGMSGMDAVSLLENMGIKVVVKGNGKVKAQSVAQGTAVNGVSKITLELS
ncbi:MULTISPECIES: penicillin-binding protein [Cellulophaga]|uniref:Peptidoglycan glycosyltransferase n=2 Tax=Cellulophaga TaxID=104264 RepID=F0RDS8_CELLC|nr:MULTISPECIES: penicillin-binding protein [Cellulophaga]ADY29839.1 Peptidoglycan glycosyltransferase [Cellulophaga lytica DSM 7489]AIM60838.1 penicillin-binding protein [Cellulophaga lytica]EWH15113.1 peptidoglycan glycosyltransferase [Cellulophaga geojensis KL-A]WQG75995.1 penicillin-binding protein [Cellulophaga lytica]SNQ44437.1 Peptidoglycan synthetase, family Transpeptidase [Cellulophaga lytica]